MRILYVMPDAVGHDGVGEYQQALYQDLEDMGVEVERLTGNVTVNQIYRLLRRGRFDTLIWFGGSDVQGNFIVKGDSLLPEEVAQLAKFGIRLAVYMACLSEVSAKMTNAVNEQIHVIASGARIEARPAYLFASSFLTKIIDGADVHSAFRFAEPPHNVSDFMYWPASMQTQDDRDAQIEYLKAELTKILVRLGDLEVAVRKMREGQTFTVDRSQAALVVIAMIMVGILFFLFVRQGG